MATGWKRWVELGLARGGATRLLERRKHHVAILAYHNVVPTGEGAVGDLGLHVDQETFADQLDLIRRHADVVPLSKIHQSPPESRFRVVITFDDAYRGAMTAGLSELEKRGMPSTVFVPTGLLGEDGFWWDRLSVPGEGLAPEVRDHVLTALQGDGRRALAWARERGLAVQSLPAFACPLTEGELLSLDGDGLTLGAHTVSHPNLCTLDPDEIRAQLVDGRRWLSERTPRYVDQLAYPYGLHDERVVRVASDVFSGALRVDGGLAGPEASSAPYRVPRVNVPRGLSLEGLLLRLVGMRR